MTVFLPKAEVDQLSLSLSLSLCEQDKGKEMLITFVIVNCFLNLLEARAMQCHEME